MFSVLVYLGDAAFKEFLGVILENCGVVLDPLPSSGSELPKHFNEALTCFHAVHIFCEYS
jgi:hypothetical protein